ncbi:MAG: hypothetical protein H6502_05235 [Candidatus Woesearchaeota archaeon]|nr:MAG: hypothetical protein H6502_05235 [Candidatus Woesearchaeota archaeon]
MNESNKKSEKEESLWEGLGKLGKAIGPFGVPFSAIFMANVLVILVILFLSSQFNWLWLAVLIFAFVEVLLGLGIYIWKEKQIIKNQ